MNSNTELNENKKDPAQNSKIKKITEERVITDPNLVLVLLHEKKRLITNLLLIKGMTIQELKKATNMNPGTIKRHLDDLVKHELIFIEREILNDYNIKMKYYRATANQFKIEFSLPE